ncbi:MAG TPA: selenocysteine-specific translation elongation factor [Acidimicrobiaceae bacterium]|nr:selenocysteine-specific translation elongation factor [Acidimicrobiaceae bacterium]
MSATHVISTAGHVDHGKSTLVMALTGTNPDRFTEEQERGLTIDLGFASTNLPSGRTIAIIDVPGHVRFLKNMLAGVGAVDACMFVVSAVEGWMPQSEEHLRILQLLDVTHGVVALTQVDLVDKETLELAQLDVAEHLEHTFLADAPVIPVDSISGFGLDDVREALDVVLGDTPQAADNNQPRLWVDRAFAAKGSGTVVTGTLTGGSLKVDDELVVEPGGRPVRIRAIQSLHQSTKKIGPGNRVALNLSGISHDQVRRGDVIVRHGQWHKTTVFDASLQVLDGLDHAISRRGAHVAYLGSGEHPVALRVLGPDDLAPGEAGFVRLRLGSAYPMLPGDRFVLRESGRSETIGGGEILDIDPVTKAAEAKPDRSVDRIIAERGWITSDQLFLLTGERRDPTIGEWVVEHDIFNAARVALKERVENADGLGLPLAELDVRHRALIDFIDDIGVDGTHVRVIDAADALKDHPFLAALDDAPFAPPGADRYDRAEVRELVRRGLVVQTEGLYFSAAAVEQAAQMLAGLLAASPDGVTVSDIRECWDTSRKFALPLLAHFDSTGVTRRRDDVRIGGPRLPQR